MKQPIKYEDFKEIESKLEIRLGMIVKVEDVAKSKLMKLTISFGDGVDTAKTCLTNIKGNFSDPHELVGSKMLFVTNLEPVEMKGILSECMIMPGTEFGKGPIILTCNGEIGTYII